MYAFDPIVEQMSVVAHSVIVQSPPITVLQKGPISTEGMH